MACCRVARLLAAHLPSPASLQWYHAIQRVEAFGHVLPASAVVRLRNSIALQTLPAPAPGAVPGYIAAEVLRQPGTAAEKLGEGQEQEQGQQKRREARQQTEGQQPHAGRHLGDGL